MDLTEFEILHQNFKNNLTDLHVDGSTKKIVYHELCLHHHSFVPQVQLYVCYIK